MAGTPVSAPVDPTRSNPGVGAGGAPAPSGPYRPVSCPTAGIPAA